MVEFIGFIISLLALLYLFIMQNRSASRGVHSERRQNEELIEDDPFKEFLKVVEKETLVREVAQHLPPPPPKIIKQQPKKKTPSALEDSRLAGQIEKRKLKSPLEDRQLRSRFNHHEELPGRNLPLSANIHRVDEDNIVGPSRVYVALQRLANRRDMIIFQEIIDKPKSIRIESPPP